MAFLPLIIALIMLLILRQSSLRAGLVTLGTTLLIVRSVPAFFLAGSHLALATEQGVGASLTVLTLLWPGCSFITSSGEPGASPSRLLP